MNCLINICSKHKKLGCDKAVKIYDGLSYQFLRNHKRSFDLYIISAKYGLINENDIICNYDLKMTNKIAESIKDSVTMKFNLIRNNYDNIYINLSKIYLKSLEINDESNIIYINEQQINKIK